MRLFLLFSVLSLFILNCGAGKSKSGKKQKKEVNVPEIKISSTAFENNDTIPEKYTCNGEDISPPLNWEGMPEGVKSIAIICDDPDAPGKTWIHWVIFNIPPEIKSLPEGVEAKDTLDSGAIQGKTDFGRVGYGGPCPPSGPAHHYHFKIYGLDEKLEAEKNITKSGLLKKMEGHILAEGELIGLYKR